MISTLYKCFQHWSVRGSVYLFSDTHFCSEDNELMDPEWIDADQQVKNINALVTKNDTLVLLGDVGNPEYAKKLRGYKVLVAGNHDAVSQYKDIFDEIYSGPLMIAEKILLSHEPISVRGVLNIHGHVHSGTEIIYWDANGNKSMNLAANVCGYRPVSLASLIKDGVLSDVMTLHQLTVKNATERKKAGDSAENRYAEHKEYATRSEALGIKPRREHGQGRSDGYKREDLTEVLADIEIESKAAARSEARSNPKFDNTAPITEDIWFAAMAAGIKTAVSSAGSATVEQIENAMRKNAFKEE